MKKLKDPQDKTERQFNIIRKTIHEWNENCNKELEIIKKKHMEILELKISLNDMKNTVVSIDGRTARQNTDLASLDHWNFENDPARGE